MACGGCTRATRSSCPTTRSTGLGRRRGPACSTARPTARAPAPSWPLHARGELPLGAPLPPRVDRGHDLRGAAARARDRGRGRGAVHGVVPTLRGQAQITQYRPSSAIQPTFPEGYGGRHLVGYWYRLLRAVLAARTRCTLSRYNYRLDKMLPYLEICIKNEKSGVFRRHIDSRLSSGDAIALELLLESRVDM